MTRFVVLQPNLEDDYVVGLEQGARYVLTGPDGRRAVFNDPADPDFVGFLTSPPSGFDSPDVRESTDDVVQGDGAVHGPFYLGRRPWTLEGIIDPTYRSVDDVDLSLAQMVNKRIDTLKRAARALRNDARLAWVPAGGLPVQVNGRQSQLRLTERMPKRFMLAMVSSDPRILGQIVRTVSGANTAPLTARNHGNWPTSAQITLRGAWLSPTITNAAGGEIRLTGNGGLTMGSADTLVIDMTAHTVVLNGTTNYYDRVLFPASDWWQLGPGDNQITATGGQAGATWTLDWRDAWV